MANTQVSITYGEKALDCEVSFEPLYVLHAYSPKYIPQDCEFTLESVSIVCNVITGTFEKPSSVAHNEDITSLIQDADMWEAIEEKSVNAIMERGYV